MVRLVHEPIDLGALLRTTAGDGALCLFLGVVRNENGGRPVLRLEYEAYEDMALPLMEQIAAEARKGWPVTVVRIVHRLGRLEIGEASVAVAVDSAVSEVVSGSAASPAGGCQVSSSSSGYGSAGRRLRSRWASIAALIAIRLSHDLTLPPRKPDMLR